MDRSCTTCVCSTFCCAIAVLISPIDAVGVNAAYDAAAAAKIPIISVARGSASPNQTLHVAMDEKQIGRDIAEWTVKAIGGEGKVAMLLPGSVNYQSWNAAGYAGLLKLKDKGMETAYSENVQAADHVEAMKDYARRGFSPIIGHSGRFLSAAQRVGPEFAKTTFLVGSGSGGQANVISLDVANEQYAYMVGVLAGKMTRSGKVGAIDIAR